MKTILFLLPFFCSNLKFDKLSNRLCKDNEEVIFSFILAENKKVVSISKDKDDKYIIYRFGTKNNVELAYPNSVDKTSWQSFKYFSMHRGGGKKNGAFGDISLCFINDNIEYKIYHYWRDEDNSNQIGVEIKIKGQTIKIKGNINSQVGALQDLDFSELIVNQAD